MSTVYERGAAQALKQINDKGRSITVVVAGTGADESVYDPSNDTFTEGTPTETIVKGLFTQFAAKDVDGELIKQSDKRILIPAAALHNAPTTDDSIVDGADTYEVINTETLKPGDLAVLYMVQVRK